MFVQFVGLWKVPHRALGLVIAPASDNSGASMFVTIFIGPLPDVANQIHHLEWATTFGVSIDLSRRAQDTFFVRWRHKFGIPIVAPRVEAAITALRRVLPFPFVGQTFARPLRIGARVVQ